MISFEAVVNNLDEALFLFDKKGRLVFINKAGEEFLGKSLKEMGRRRVEELFPGTEDIAALLKKTIKEGRSFNCNDMEIEVGRTLSVNAHISPFYPSGTLEGALLCIRENLSIASREDYHFDTLLYLIGSIAHEIKNPLSGIKGAAQLLRGSARNAEALECVELILKESDRLNLVLQSYLTMTRTPVFNRLNIHEVVEHAVKVMGTSLEEQGIRIDKSYDPSLPMIRGDESKLLQVFINLLKNAVEAMDTPRHVRNASASGRRRSSVPGRDSQSMVLGISTRPSNEYMVTYEGEGPKKNAVYKKHRWVVVTVRDNGSGIPADEMKRVFLPFYTKKAGGSGLGLALSKKIIKDHGGTIKVRSKQGHGTTVGVYLPLPVAHSDNE